MVLAVIVDTQLFEGNLSVFLSSKRFPSGCETWLYMALNAAAMSVENIQKGTRFIRGRMRIYIVICFRLFYWDEKCLSILHPVVRITEVMPDVGKFHPFPAKLCAMRVHITHCPYLAIYSSWLFLPREL